MRPTRGVFALESDACEQYVADEGRGPLATLDTRLHSSFAMTTNVKDTIDDAAAKAKEIAEKAGQAVKDAAGKVAEVSKDAADKVKDAADHAAEKLGAKS